MSARAQAYAALIASDPQAKCDAVAAIDVNGADIEVAFRFVSDGVPGRPARPLLVHPREVPHRGLGSPTGRIGLIHAIAHIEFNAINLALDAVCRFDGMPTPFYRDWLQVAQDEARHFRMLRERLHTLGAEYGDCPAHNGLWEAAEKTAHDVLVRMALVPRVLEARGLDVTPGMMARLREVGDAETLAILEVILTEEVGHVAAGTRWFWHLCAQRHYDPAITFRKLMAEYDMRLHPPLNREARALAGFTAAELEIPGLD